jgi:hypothetical protein
MLRLILSSFLVGAMAMAADDSKVIEFPNEISAIFSSKDYNRALKEAKDKLPKGHEIGITGASFQKIGDKTYAYVHLVKRRTMMFPVISFPYGTLAGEVKYGPEAEVLVEKIYYSPPAEPAK